jgi:hypothetical protein
VTRRDGGHGSRDGMERKLVRGDEGEKTAVGNSDERTAPRSDQLRSCEAMAMAQP